METQNHHPNTTLKASLSFGSHVIVNQTLFSVTFMVTNIMLSSSFSVGAHLFFFQTRKNSELHTWIGDIVRSFAVSTGQR